MFYLTFAIFTILLILQIRRLRFPWFCTYLAVLLIHLAVWKWAVLHPAGPNTPWIYIPHTAIRWRGLGWLPFVEPWLITAKLMACLEALDTLTGKLSVRERQLLLAVIGGFATLAGTVVYYYGGQPDWYRAAREYVSVCLGFAAVYVIGYVWSDRKGMEGDSEAWRHALILTVYLVKEITTSVIPIHMTDPRWKVVSKMGLIGSVACGIVWGFNTIPQSSYRSLLFRTASIFLTLLDKSPIRRSSWRRWISLRTSSKAD